MTQSDTTSAAGGGETITILYTNWRGETAVRRIVPGSKHEGLGALWLGETEWHLGAQWLLSARDVEKDVYRVFALSGIKAWGQEAVDAALAAPAATGGTEELPRGLIKFFRVFRQSLLGEENGMPCVREFTGEIGKNSWFAGESKRLLNELLALRSSPTPPAGAAGGSGDLAALSAGASAVVGSLDWGTHDVRPNPHGTGRWCARCGVLETTCSLEGNLCRPLYAGAKPYGGRAPTPDLGAQGEPVAWAYEVDFYGRGDAWQPRVDLDEPTPRDWLRNIRPLYAAPAAPRTGPSASDLIKAIHENVSAVTAASGETWVDYAQAQEVITALFAQAPRDGGETQGEWQPIETAPKDGRDILGYCPTSGEQFVACFVNGYWQFAYFGPADCPIVCDELSFWRPLPTPPSGVETIRRDSEGATDE